MSSVGPRNYSGFHFNGNLPCAIDCETTGLVPHYHDLIEICVIPLTSLWEQDKTRPIFHMQLRPKRPQNFDKAAGEITQRSLDHCLEYGTDPYSAQDLFDTWYSKLRLPEKKQIIPVGMNYLSFDMLFIMDWLGGILNYRHYFRSDARDAMITALHQNDVAEYKSEQVPFSKVNLAWLATTLGVDRVPKHDALSDALCTAEVYKRLIKRML